MEHLYFIERGAIAIVKHSGGQNFASPTSVKTVTMFVIKEDDEFISGTSNTDEKIHMTQSPSFDPEFHEALAYKVIAEGYEKKPETLELAGYFRQLFELKARDALEAANKGIDGSGYTIAGYDI